MRGRDRQANARRSSSEEGRSWRGALGGRAYSQAAASWQRQLRKERSGLHSIPSKCLSSSHTEGGSVLKARAPGGTVTAVEVCHGGGLRPLRLFGPVSSPSSAALRPASTAQCQETREPQMRSSLLSLLPSIWFSFIFPFTAASLCILRPLPVPWFSKHQHIHSLRHKGPYRTRKSQSSTSLIWPLAKANTTPLPHVLTKRLPTKRLPEFQRS